MFKTPKEKNVYILIVLLSAVFAGAVPRQAAGKCEAPIRCYGEGGTIITVPCNLTGCDVCLPGSPGFKEADRIYGCHKTQQSSQTPGTSDQSTDRIQTMDEFINNIFDRNWWLEVYASFRKDIFNPLWWIDHASRFRNDIFNSNWFLSVRATFRNDILNPAWWRDIPSRFKNNIFRR